MTNDIANRVIDAVITILTTIIIVRYTMLGGLGITQTFKDRTKARLRRIKRTSIKILAVGLPLAFGIICFIGLFRITRRIGPVERKEVLEMMLLGFAGGGWIRQAGVVLTDVFGKSPNPPPSA